MFFQFLDDNGLYPIHEAVLEGNHEKILSLLNGGDNFNCLNDNNETPVHLAVILKDYDALKLLLSHCSQLAMEGYSSSLLLATSEADELSIQVHVKLTFRVLTDLNIKFWIIINHILQRISQWYQW